MASARPAIHVVEKNPYAPRPYVFSEVAVCLRDAIRAAGYDSELLHNRIDPQAFSIVLGIWPDKVGELEHLDPRRCAVFNFEQLGSTSTIAGPEYRRWLAGWLVLDYHGSNIEVLRRENGSHQLAFELPLVPSPGLQTSGDEAKDIDVLFYGTMSERRSQVLRQLEAMGLKVEAVAGAYGPELAPAIRRAKLVLHVHFYESGLFPVARIVQPVIMGVPVVCEDSVFSELNDWSHSGIVFADYAHLAEACRDLLEAPDRMAVRARMARAYVREIDFATPFARVVRAFDALAHGAPAAAPAPAGDHALSDEEIARILEEEGAELPPEADAPVPPVKMVERQPGKGPYGKWVLAVLIVFSFYTIWLSMRG
ncbi:glycosyltransferase [Ramlibacter sp. PS4R-6]|uniref:glycosyltransferase n=1 Tax=Ramlibacter sp. PS4R-6 TaxID=3133438 RepID=UPI003095B837